MTTAAAAKFTVNVLAFDCSTLNCSVAVVADGRLLADRQAAPGCSQAEALMPMILAVMTEAGLGWADIGLIGVTVGPGSFTGLRIGLAAARGIALAGGLPVAGVTTTDAVAHAVPALERQGRTLLVAVDGKRAELFVQPFAADLRPLADPQALLPAAAATLIDGPLLLAGDAACRVFPHRPDAWLSTADGPPDAPVVARLAAMRYAAGSGLPARPLYLRPPDVTLAGAR
jgi:tRNA threonylcarbamoyladenosine biosynthesis protein TsaB